MSKRRKASAVDRMEILMSWVQKLTSAWTWTLFAFGAGWSCRPSRTSWPGRAARTLLTWCARRTGWSRDTRVAFVTLWSRRSGRPWRAFKTATKCQARKNRNCCHCAHANSSCRFPLVGTTLNWRLGSPMLSAAIPRVLYRQLLSESPKRIPCRADAARCGTLHASV